MKIQTIPTKYTIGDKVWLMAADNRIVQGEITDMYIRISKDKPTAIDYNVEHEEWGVTDMRRSFTCGQIFDTKEELIKTL